jgi:hypothetical protein
VEGVHGPVAGEARAQDQEGSQGESEHTLPGSLTPELEGQLQGLALRAFEALECLDFARADFRLDAADQPVFLEINPLPTFAEDGSFGILAELEGRPVEALLGEVFAAGLERLGFSRSESEAGAVSPSGTSRMGGGS